jgi:hypothetical protein
MMKTKLTGALSGVAIVVSSIGLIGMSIALAGQSGTQEGTSAGAQGEPQETLAAKDDMRPAEQVYKNIQYFKGLPAHQLVDVMKFFTRSLGVRCEYCHVTAPGSKIPGFGAFSKDDMEAKRTARRMNQLVGAIRKNFFSEKDSPSCWTCHRGSTKPELEPPATPATGNAGR